MNTWNSNLGIAKDDKLRFKYVPALYIHEAMGDDGPDDKLSCAF